jgi:hypothetical protein
MTGGLRGKGMLPPVSAPLNEGSHHEKYDEHFLGRAADPADLSQAIALLGAGRRDEDLIAALLTSSELFNKTAS